MKRLFMYIFLSTVFLLMFSCSKDEIIVEELTCEEQIDMVPFNVVQVIGSHNSYRIRPDEAILQLVRNSADILPPDFTAESWDYGHVNLIEQFNSYNVRSVEIDVYRDPSGGLFYVRKGNALVGLDPDSKESDLLEPGLKVLHFPDFDYLTHHLTFKDALETVKAWSSNNPRHVPISILVEAKEDSPDELLPGFGLTSTMAFDEAGVNGIEAEIETVFEGNMNQLFVPDQLKGTHSTLNAAVTAGAWPLLNEMRGKIIIVLMGTDEIIDHYKNGHASLAGRKMFVFTDPGTPESAFVKMDNPVANASAIQQRIAEGYIVRTRADADTNEARTGDYTRLMAAISSGAQIISTDYYKADARALSDMGFTDYEVHFENDELAILNDTEEIDGGVCFIVE